MDFGNQGGAADAPVRVPLPGGEVVEGDLVVPDGARAIVVFAHGSGSSRHSTRNRIVAEEMHRGGLATLLMDLLTAEEEAVDQRSRELRFDIELLATRLEGAADWLAADPRGAGLGLGYFGASTGAAAALVAAARRPEEVGAVVSRGGRPDLAGGSLTAVRAPTLLIVGGLDDQVIDLNRQAADQLQETERHLEIVPGATHLFEEPGTLEQAANLATDWFTRHIAAETTDHSGR